MKNLVKKLPQLTDHDTVDFLVDTCFFIWIFEHNKQKEFDKFLKKYTCAITSFNAEELFHVTHTIHDKLKEAERRFFHHTSNLHLLSIPVHPGDKTAEQRFVKQLLPDFDCREHDPSDAVILAVAVKIHANILTRDKHDLFNVALKNCLNDYDIKVFNTFPNR